MSKITKLEVTNFKKIRCVEIEPSGAVVQIKGRNGAGKSSCLDAIAAALGGEKLAPKEPVRRGADGAVVRVELDDGLVVERRWTAAGGSSLKLSTKDGARFDKPQKRLDEIVGRLSFDPLAFGRLAPKEQAETLRKLSGVDFTLLDGKRRAAYGDRTAANRVVLAVRARLAALPEVEAPAEPVSAADLLEEQERRREAAAANDRKRQELSDARKEYATTATVIKEAEAEILRIERSLAETRAMLDGQRANLATAEARGKALLAEVERLVDPDLDEVPRRLRDVEAVNERVRQRRARADAAAELAKVEAEAAKLDAEIASIDERKAATLASANLPVPGLAFTDEGVTFESLPLEQASQAAQLRISLAIGSALNPKLRAMLVRDGSLLDEDSLALLKAEAERAGMQVWLEMVSRTGEGIVIEDGQVEGAEAPAEAAHA